MINSSLVFITGISGFVGQNLKSYLAKNFQILGISRMKTGNSLNYENFFREKPDYKAIIHLAGKAHDLKKVSNPHDYYEANFQLTRQLFDAFLVSDAGVFIFMSTVKAVADEVKGVLTEEWVVNSDSLHSKFLQFDPKTHYGIAKHMAEEYILSKEVPKGKRVFILRPCMIHGLGNKGNLNLLYQIAAKRIPWPLGAFENQRSFCSIDNLCFVINEILENESIPSGIYNLADDVAISTNKLITLIAHSQNKRAHILKIPKGVISGIAKIGNLLKLPLNSERLQKLTESYIVSNEKIVKAIGKPLPYSTEKGLVKTFESFKLNP